ncbi:MAG: DNA gyrase inhibitor YacG [Planctomycetota bacterium]
MRCPTCNNEFDLTTSDAKPFCSQRCKTIDLGRWLDESYSLPHVPDPEDDELADEDWAGKPLTAADEIAEAEKHTDV